MLISSWCVSAVFDVTGAFSLREFIEERTDPAPCGFDGSLGSFPEKVLELGEHLFDWIEVGAIGWQEQQFRAHAADGGSDCQSFVTAEIIHDDDVAFLERRNKDGLDIDAEGLAVDGAVEHPRRRDAVISEGGDECHRVPVTEGNGSVESLTFRTPAAQGSHVCLGPGFVNEDQPGWVDAGLTRFPSLAFTCHIRAITFAGDCGFF